MSSHLDAEHIREWRAYYERAYNAYVRGALTQQEALDLLAALRYRDDALRIEMKVWENAKLRRQNAAHFAARKKLGLVPESS